MAGHYFYEIDVPANLAEASAIESEVILTPGILNYITISFPDGAGGLVHCQIMETEHILFPTNPDVSYAWNDYTFPIFTSKTIYQHNNRFKIKAWNFDELYQHTISVAFNVLPPDDENANVLQSIKNLIFG